MRVLLGPDQGKDNLDHRTYYDWGWVWYGFGNSRARAGIIDLGRKETGGVSDFHSFATIC
jgi:hypothetical protein